VVESQRWRLAAAAAELLAECGYARTNSHRVSDRAGVSRRTFYDHFSNLPAALLLALEAVAAAAEEAAVGACGRELDDAARLTAALSALAELFDAEPANAALLGVEAAAISAPMAARRELLIGRLGAGLASLRSAETVSTPVLRAKVAAALSLLAASPAGSGGEGVREQLARLLAA
jgi:AcrR family transcriptional regulator